VARTFNGASSEVVGFTPRTWDAWTGFTIACLLRRAGTGGFDTLYYSGPNGGLLNGEIQMGLDNNDDLYVGIGGTSRTIATTITAANWAVGASKATGTATPVSHRAVAPFTTWTHANMSGTLANPATTAQTVEEIGRWNGPTGNADYMDGDIEWLGIWNFSMSNNEFEALFRMNPGRLPLLYPGCQRFYWFNQNVSDTVRDLSNHLADQTNRTGTTMTQAVQLMPNIAESVPSLVPGLL
jgi:hypothetical protein